DLPWCNIVLQAMLNELLRRVEWVRQLGGDTWLLRRDALAGGFFYRLDEPATHRCNYLLEDDGSRKLAFLVQSKSHSIRMGKRLLIQRPSLPIDVCLRMEMDFRSADFQFLFFIERRHRRPDIFHCRRARIQPRQPGANSTVGAVPTPGKRKTSI